MAFIPASFAANRPATCGTGSLRRRQYASSSVRQDTGEETVPVSLDGGRDAREVGRVHADAHDGHARYSTMRLDSLKRCPIRSVPTRRRLPAAFTWTGQPWGALLQCVPLARLAIHGWTTRELAIVAGPADCEAQWQQLAASGGVSRHSLAAVHQVHGAAVIDAPAGEAQQRPRADGLVSGDPSLMLTVRVADCAALLIADSRRGAVAAVHAGWRGTAAGIAAVAVARLA